jgi:hypothetical protein
VATVPHIPKCAISVKKSKKWLINKLKIKIPKTVSNEREILVGLGSDPVSFQKGEPVVTHLLNTTEIWYNNMLHVQK